MLLVASNSFLSIWLSRSKASFCARKEATIPWPSVWSPAFWRRMVSSWMRLCKSKMLSSFSFSFLSRSSTWACSCAFASFACRSCFSSWTFFSFRSSKSLLRSSASKPSPADSTKLSNSTWIEGSMGGADSRLRICSCARWSWLCSSWPFSSLILWEMSSSVILRFRDIFSSSRRLALSRLLSLFVSIRLTLSLEDWYAFSSSLIFWRAVS